MYLIVSGTRFVRITWILSSTVHRFGDQHSRAAYLSARSSHQAVSSKHSGWHPPESDRTRAAKEAGVAEHQRTTALCAANVPKEEFERTVKSQQPPTVTARAGTISWVPITGRGEVPTRNSPMMVSTV
jgi:hypothetical protein